ncbi:MAG TPA: ATP-dependent Clp protease proteolytic subunit [Acidimicrobiales bacterium]|nr:ATP-dependent Clp protease proteolytic subunit [Acidimicrobiales bacterium]
MTDREMGRDIGRDGDWSDTLARRLYEQRVVLLRGPLDDLTATRVAAELMTLDAEGDEAISLRIDCGDGTLAVALTLMDVIELSGVPVRALCMGQVGGPALGPLAVCQHRAAMPSTRFSLREPATQLEAPAREVSQWVELRADERRRFCARLAAAVGRPEPEVAEDLAAGRFMGVDEAQAYGLIDEVCRPDAAIHQLPSPPIGFRPRR